MPFKYYFESIYKVKYLQAHWIQHRLVEGSFFLSLYYFFLNQLESLFLTLSIKILNVDKIPVYYYYTWMTRLKEDLNMDSNTKEWNIYKGNGEESDFRGRKDRLDYCPLRIYKKEINSLKSEMSHIDLSIKNTVCLPFRIQNRYIRLSFLKYDFLNSIVNSFVSTPVLPFLQLIVKFSKSIK